METGVWQFIVQAATFLSSLLASSNTTQKQESGGASPDAPVSGASSTSTSMNATILAVTRVQETNDGIFGELAINGEKVCLTLENRALSIPTGQYGITIYDSSHAGHPVPLLQGVLGRSEIEIHCGNVPEDSKGCILLGLSRIGDSLEESRDAFNLVFPVVSSAIHSGAVVRLVLTDSYTS